jgi:hypothetical protein
VGSLQQFLGGLARGMSVNVCMCIPSHSCCVDAHTISLVPRPLLGDAFHTSDRPLWWQPKHNGKSPGKLLVIDDVHTSLLATVPFCKTLRARYTFLVHC